MSEDSAKLSSDAFGEWECVFKSFVLSAIQTQIAQKHFPHLERVFEACRFCDDRIYAAVRFATTRRTAFLTVTRLSLPFFAGGFMTLVFIFIIFDQYVLLARQFAESSLPKATGVSFLFHYHYFTYTCHSHLPKASPDRRSFSLIRLRRTLAVE